MNLSRVGAVVFVAGCFGSVVAGEAIQDNSFLLEEAYNQEAGVVQHIGTYARFAGSGDWTFSFTQEWPVPSVRHQLSYTALLVGVHDAGVERGFGDLAINYRYQLFGDGRSTVAVAPRLSLLLPTGDPGSGTGTGGAGVQVNIPTSVVLHERVVSHVNLGATWIRSAENRAGDRTDLTGFNIGQSFVGLLTPRFNVLFEFVYNTGEAVSDLGGSERFETFFVNPGIRWAYDFESGLQIVPGISVPLGFGPSGDSRAVFFYLSFEHPFTKAARAR